MGNPARRCAPGRFETIRSITTPGTSRAGSAGAPRTGPPGAGRGRRAPIAAGTPRPGLSAAAGTGRGRNTFFRGCTTPGRGRAAAQRFPGRPLRLPRTGRNTVAPRGDHCRETGCEAPRRTGQEMGGRKTSDGTVAEGSDGSNTSTRLITGRIRAGESPVEAWNGWHDSQEQATGAPPQQPSSKPADAMEGQTRQSRRIGMSALVGMRSPPCELLLILRSVSGVFNRLFPATPIRVKPASLLTAPDRNCRRCF